MCEIRLVLLEMVPGPARLSIVQKTSDAFKRSGYRQTSVGRLASRNSGESRDITCVLAVPIAMQIGVHSQVQVVSGCCPA